MSLGIEFDETMTGPFALGESDPEAGRARGESAGTQLAMHATVRIPDLETFIADPRHTGGLEGRVDFAPLGMGLTARAGVFNLFAPGGEAGLKLMVYELAFDAAGESFYLAGRKEVRDDQGFDVWSDTTTLFTTLHAGNDATGAVRGAGVLGLGARDLMDLLSTVRVTGATSAAKRAATVARFGTFFMGELWDTYGPELLRRHGGG